MTTETITIDVGKTGAVAKIADFKHLHRTRFLESLTPKLVVVKNEGSMFTGCQVFSALKLKEDSYNFLRFDAKIEKGLLKLTATLSQE